MTFCRLSFSIKIQSEDASEKGMRLIGRSRRRKRNKNGGIQHNCVDAQASLCLHTFTLWKQVFPLYCRHSNIYHVYDEIII